MAGSQLRSTKRALSMRLQRVESSELVEFPSRGGPPGEGKHFGQTFSSPFHGTAMFTPTVCVQLMGCADPVVLFPVPHAGALPRPLLHIVMV